VCVLYVHYLHNVLYEHYWYVRTHVGLPTVYDRPTCKYMSTVYTLSESKYTRTVCTLSP